MHTTQPPEGVPPAIESQFGQDGWPAVTADPEPFLSLRLSSPRWLVHLPGLAEASATAEIEGTSLLHFDVRSDNLCPRDGSACCRLEQRVRREPGARYRLLAPSLEAEGGPAPDVILPDETPGLPAIASLLAGYSCAWVGLPAIPQAPHARPLQLMQSKTALPWAARLLDLPLQA